MTIRQESEQRYRRELEQIRRRKETLLARLQEGRHNHREIIRRWRALEELERCCKDNLLVLREPGPQRLISYSGGENAGPQGDNKIFFIAGDLKGRQDNSANRKKVAKAVREIMERELSPETCRILLRCLAGEPKSQIAQELGVEVSTVVRRYQKGMKELRRYCVYLEKYLR